MFDFIGKYPRVYDLERCLCDMLRTSGESHNHDLKRWL